jgi:hypothetical protein
MHFGGNEKKCSIAIIPLWIASVKESTGFCAVIDGFVRLS